MNSLHNNKKTNWFPVQIFHVLYRNGVLRTDVKPNPIYTICMHFLGSVNVFVFQILCNRNWQLIYSGAGIDVKTVCHVPSPLIEKKSVFKMKINDSLCWIHSAHIGAQCVSRLFELQQNEMDSFAACHSGQSWNALFHTNEMW